MFDIGALELLVIVIVAIVVIGPKEMPQALRLAGRWIGKIRRTSAQFRSGFDNLVREAEMEEMEKKWKEQNARIMAETPAGEMRPIAEDMPGSASEDASVLAEGEPVDLMADVAADDAASKKPATKKAAPKRAASEKPPVKKAVQKAAKKPKKTSDEPMLPLGKPDRK